MLLSLLDSLYIVIHMFIFVNKIRVLQAYNKKNLFLKTKRNNNKL